MNDENTNADTEWYAEAAGNTWDEGGENELRVVELRADVPQEKLRQYKVTVKATETDFTLTSIRLFADDVKLQHLREVPLTKVRAAAFGRARQLEELHDDADPADIFADPFIDTLPMMPGNQIPVRDFKRAYRDAAANRDPRKRQILAEQFHVSVYTIDKWVRHARDIGEIPKPQRNKPQTPTTEENE
ncbi:MAG: hypothetical protein ACTHW7_12460 [Actinomycetaceae bacterium]|jgi:hypothetical protein